MLCVAMSGTRPGMFLAAFVSVAVGLSGWFPLLISAGVAQGDEPNHRLIVTTLALAGAASVVSVSSAILGLVQAHARSSGLAATISAVGLVAGVPLGLTALVFALTFHW
jgi:hypothetical protein